MRAAKVDANQSAIVSQLREIGCTVQDLSRVGGGVPDLLVGFRGVNLLMEVKTAKGKLNPRQVDWHGEWRGDAVVVRDFDDALRVIEGVTV